MRFVRSRTGGVTARELAGSVCTVADVNRRKTADSLSRRSALPHDGRPGSSWLPPIWLLGLLMEEPASFSVDRLQRLDRRKDESIAYAGVCRTTQSPAGAMKHGKRGRSLNGHPSVPIKTTMMETDRVSSEAAGGSQLRSETRIQRGGDEDKPSLGSVSRTYDCQARGDSSTSQNREEGRRANISLVPQKRPTER